MSHRQRPDVVVRGCAGCPARGGFGTARAYCRLAGVDVDLRADVRTPPVGCPLRGGPIVIRLDNVDG